MKSILCKHPAISRYILAILLFGLSLIISGFVNKGIIKQYVPYTSVILLLLATWVMYKTDNKSLNAIGLNFKLKSISFLPLGFFIGAITFFVAKYVRALYTGESFAISNSIEYSTILYAFYFILPQVATEEFLFRGYLFKKTIEISSVVIANIIFSIMFMLIHVLDENILNNIGMIVFMTITIPVGHLLFATALLKSKTLFFPIGIHLGNNWATRHLITSSNSENSFLYITNPATFDNWTPFITFLLIFNGIFLLATFLIWKWDLIIRLFKQSN